MLQITDIRKGVKVKIINNPAIANNVYVIHDVFVTECGLRLDLMRADDRLETKRDEKATDCELA